MTNRIALLYTARHLALCRNLRRFPQSFQLIKTVEPCLGLPQFNRSTVEEGGSSGTWQLIIRDDENIFYVIWCSHRMCVCVCMICFATIITGCGWLSMSVAVAGNIMQLCSHTQSSHQRQTKELHSPLNIYRRRRRSVNAAPMMQPFTVYGHPCRSYL